MRTMLLLAFLLAAAPAAAEQLAYLPNRAGGEIVLMSDQSPSCKGNRLVWSRASTGAIVTGCWFAEGHYVTVIWSDDGQLSVFKIADFRLFDEPAAASRTGDMVTYR